MIIICYDGMILSRNVIYIDISICWGKLTAAAADTCMQELLPVHPPYVQCEEAGAAPGQGYEHRGHYLRGRP
jgi:hypothetical protein